MKRTLLISFLLLMVFIVAGLYYWQNKILSKPQVIAKPTNPAITVNEEKISEIDNETDEDKAQIKKTNNKINVLILATDASGIEVSRTDLIMFLTANIDTRRVAIITIPRDTRVDIPGVGLTKINHANAVGEAKGDVRAGTLASANAVSNLLGVPINYYVKINFQGFVKAVDVIGGIDVDLPNPVNDDLRNIHLPAGQNHLTGDQALRLSRARYGLPNGDFDRQKNNFYLLAALANQMLSFSNISKLPEIIDIVYQELVDTNMSAAEVAAIALKFKGITRDEITYYQIPGQGVLAHDPLVGRKVYYYEVDIDAVQEVLQQAFSDVQ
jgi:LCP family protein required for cell wall assembly